MFGWFFVLFMGIVSYFSKPASLAFNVLVSSVSSVLVGKCVSMLVYYCASELVC